MSFANGKQVMHEVETIICSLFKYAGLSIPRPVPRMTYQTAMDIYGSDKPDIRIPHEVCPSALDVKKVN